MQNSCHRVISSRCWVEKSASDTFNMVGEDPDPTIMTPDKCKTSCAGVPGAALAGITNGKTCFCGEGGTEGKMLFNLSHLRTYA